MDASYTTIKGLVTPFQFSSNQTEPPPPAATMSSHLEEEVKQDVYHNEAGDHHQIHHTQNEVQHGDHALKILGDERIELTEADVSGDVTCAPPTSSCPFPSFPSETIEMVTLMPLPGPLHPPQD